MNSFKENIDILGCGAIYIDEELEIMDNTLFFGKEYIIQKKRKPGGSVVNFSLECAKKGLSTSIIGCIGKDRSGNKILRDLERHQISTKYIQIDSVQKTGHSLCILNNRKESVMLTDIGANQYLDIDDFLAIANVTPKILYLSGIFKIKSFNKSYINLIKWAKGNNVIIAVDHGRFISDVTNNQISILNNILKTSDFYFPNENEILQFTNTDTITDAVNTVIRTYPRLITAIKLGPKGCMVVERGKIFSKPAVDCSEITTTVGAGDAFNAGFLIKYAIEGSSLEDAAKFANQIAAEKICSHN